MQKCVYTCLRVNHIEAFKTIPHMGNEVTKQEQEDIKSYKNPECFVQGPGAWSTKFPGFLNVK